MLNQIFDPNRLNSVIKPENTANPYSDIDNANQAIAQATAAAPQAVSALGSAQQNLSATQNMDSSYPVMNQSQQSNPAAVSYGQVSNPSTNPSNAGAVVDSSRGFNPWSLVGEANSR